MDSVILTSMDLTPGRLQALRELGDPLADAVIADAFQSGNVGALNALMNGFVANEHAVPNGTSAPLQAYFAKSAVLPDWARPDLIEAGEQVFWRFGPRIILILFCYGLPFTYLGRNGVPVLTLTTRLVSNPQRRIVETAQMVVDAMQPGGIVDAQGRGRLTIQKVRLMHAAIRRLVPAAAGWNTANGLPVNQEDLAGTLMGFCWISLDGLEKIGVSLTDQDREAYVHCWSVIGHLLGVNDDIVPKSVAEARALSAAIAGHQFGPTPEAKELTSALIAMMAHILPGNIFDHAPALFIRYFLGKQWAEWLGVEDGLLARFVASPLRFAGMEFSGAIEDSRTLSILAERLGHLLINAIVLVERGGNRPSFAIPSELRQQWGVNWTS